MTATGATLNGTVDESATAHFEYGTDDRRTASTTPTQAVDGGRRTAPDHGPDGRDDVPLPARGRRRAPADRTFTTTANPQPPAIANQHSREITPDAATTTATVNANGSATTYTIEWGTTTRYGSQTAAASAGTAGRPRP